MYWIRSASGTHSSRSPHQPQQQQQQQPSGPAAAGGGGSSAMGAAGGGSDTRRVLVVGDSAAGKSLLIALLCASGGGGGGCIPQSVPSLPPSRLAPTIGCNAEVMMWAASGSRRQCIELVEIGGGRTMLPAARLSCYGAVDGVIFVYHQRNPSSAVALFEWFRELRDAGIVGGKPRNDGGVLGESNPHSTVGAGGITSLASSATAGLGSNSSSSSMHRVFGGGNAIVGPKPFIVVGTQLPQSSRSYGGDVDGFLDIVANPTGSAGLFSGSSAPSGDPWRVGGTNGGGGFHSVAGEIPQRHSPSTLTSILAAGCAAGSPAARLLVRVIGLWAMWQRVLLLGLSFVLFGVNQTVVPVRVPTYKRAIDTIRNDEGCQASVEACALDSGADFAATSEDVRCFLASLW